MSKRELSINEIVRIEGHLDVSIYLSDGQVNRVQAKAIEGTRILERFLVGRSYLEVPEMASRMCGVCSAIHKVSSVQAVENALGIVLPEKLQKLRELLVIGGHLHSHVIHMFFFVLPDYYGKDSALDLLPSDPEFVKKLIKIRKIINDMLKILGGSLVHPITPVAGGFAKPIYKKDLQNALNILKLLRKEIMDPIRFELAMGIPELEVKNTYVAVTDGKTVPLLHGDIRVFPGGKTYKPNEYQKVIKPLREKYSTAPHFLLDNRETYYVGAISRLNINHLYLSDAAKELCKEFNISFPMDNPFANNTAQLIEIVHYMDVAEQLLNDLISDPPKETRVDFEIKAGEGIAVTEAPRGMLIHHYKFNSEGYATWANIITPTAQNLKNIEKTAKAYTEALVNLGVEGLLKFEIEKLVRAYDPCLSCSARFYKENP